VATEPIIVDPDDYDQRDAVAKTLTLLERVADENALGDYSVVDKPLGRYFGLYKPLGRLYYDSKVCRRPVKTPGYAWSFTGYKADRTAPGVIAHEMGHHAWEVITRRLDGGVVSRRRRTMYLVWKEIAKKEAEVTSYASHIPEEDFAEAFKVFVLNPDLLRTGRPVRWAAMSALGLKPAFDVPWELVLIHAHDKIIAAAKKWIAKGGAR
jgi:hypothetical protein